MVLVIVRVDKKVIHVDDKPSFCYHISEGNGHESLKCGRGVGHAKEHDHWFIESTVGDKGCLPLVSFLDANIVVTPSYVKLSKNFGILEFVYKVRD